MSMMDHKIITSRDNSLLRLARAVRDGKEDDLIFVEGLRLCEEALKSQLTLEAVLYSEEIVKKERAAAFIQQVDENARQLVSVSEKLLETVSYTKTPQGIIALARRPSTDVQRLNALSFSSPRCS